MKPINQEKAARMLKMQVNGRGADLVDEEKIVEVKYNLLHQNRYTHRSWRVHEYQMEYGKKKLAFWAFGFYRMDREVSEIKTTNLQSLGKMVMNRSLYIVPWSWMFQYKKYRQRGKGKAGPWDNTLRFPKYRELPPTKESWQVEGGLVHITQDVPKDLFILTGKKLEIIPS